jgi:DMSO/TMAO reductase YedYZ heme-binding membrane subunit
MADSTMRFGLIESLVPFRSPWREPWTGLGVIAAELGLVVGASIGLRRLIGYRAWKALHWLSLPVFLLGLAHGVMAGTDSMTPVMDALYLITGGWVIFLLTYRVLTRSLRHQQRAFRRGGPRPDRARV